MSYPQERQSRTGGSAGDQIRGEGAEERLLIFDWKHRDPRWHILAWSLVLAVMGLAASFVVFRITQRPLRQEDGPVRSVVLLTPGSVEARRLIDHARDASYLLLPDEEAETAALAQPLAEAVPSFSPSFKGFRLRPRDLGQSEAPAIRPRLFSPLRAPLPAVTAAPRLGLNHSPGAAVAPAEVIAEVSAKVFSRWVNPTGPLFSELLGTDIGASYRIAIDPAGRVITALPMTESAQQAAEDLSQGNAAEKARHSFVRSLRFKPQPTAPSPQWAVLTLRWQRVAGAGPVSAAGKPTPTTP